MSKCGAKNGTQNGAESAVRSDTERGTNASPCSTAEKIFREQAQARVARFYADLAQFGEVPPAARLRLEGFLEAGLTLELVARDEVVHWVNDSYSRYLAAEHDQRVSVALANADECIVALPVRWRRAPVHPS